MAEEYIYAILPGTDWREHTPEHPFCGEDDCPCHEDGDNLQALQDWYNDGLIGATDGKLIYDGKTI